MRGPVSQLPRSQQDRRSRGQATGLPSGLGLLPPGGKSFFFVSPTCSRWFVPTWLAQPNARGSVEFGCFCFLPLLPTCSNCGFGYCGFGSVWVQVFGGFLQKI